MPFIQTHFSGKGSWQQAEENIFQTRNGFPHYLLSYLACRLFGDPAYDPLDPLHPNLELHLDSAQSNSRIRITVFPPQHKCVFFSTSFSFLVGGGHSLALLFFPPVLCTCFLSPFLRFPEIFPGNLPGNRGQLLLLLLSSSASSSAPLRLLRRSRWEEGRKRILVAHRMHQALSCKKGNKK